MIGTKDKMQNSDFEVSSIRDRQKITTSLSIKWHCLTVHIPLFRIISFFQNQSCKQPKPMKLPTARVPIAIVATCLLLQTILYYNQQYLQLLQEIYHNSYPNNASEAFDCVLYIYSTFFVTIALYIFCDDTKLNQRPLQTNQTINTRNTNQNHNTQWHDITTIPPAPTTTPKSKKYSPTSNSPWIATSPSSGVYQNTNHHRKTRSPSQSQPPSFASPASAIHPPPTQFPNNNTTSMRPRISFDQNNSTNNDTNSNEHKSSPPPQPKRIKLLPHEIHPVFPSLKIREVMSNTILHPNSRAPIPFQTETFKGEILIMLKTNPQDPYYQSHFGTKKRMLEVHIQGVRFKNLKIIEQSSILVSSLYTRIVVIR